MRTKYISIVSILMLAFTSILCAQINNGIIKVTAYQQEISGGNIPVDIDGKPMRKAADTSFFLVIETKAAQAPKLEKAYRSGISYTLKLTDSTQKDQTELISARGQTLKADKGNRLWRYTLSIADDNKVTINPTANTITITGNYKGKNIVIPIKEIITLAPEMRP